jgi:hypothetical protein
MTCYNASLEMIVGIVIMFFIAGILAGWSTR